MKNINSKYCLCKKGSYEPKFISDATTLDDFIEDLKQYFNFNPSGYYPYTIKIVLKRTIGIDKILDLLFTKIEITHILSNGNEASDEYYIYDIPCIEKNKGISMRWDTIRSKCLKIDKV